MAVIHDAVLRPAKTEVIGRWLPTQAWSGVDSDPEADGSLTVLGRFRFDDPAGQVGVETYLVRVGDGPVLQVPLTYRGAPLDGASAYLLAEMHHSALGQRWVYDATGDPVYADVLRRAIVTGGHEAELQRAEGVGTLPKEGRVQGTGTATDSPTVSVARPHTSGTTTTIDTDHGALVVVRVLGGTVPAGATLDGGPIDADPTVLAVLVD